MFMMSWRLSKLAESGTMSHEQASLVKAWNTLRGREVRAAGCWWDRYYWAIA
jgi:acyl-CoA oxidase